VPHRERQKTTSAVPASSRPRTWRALAQAVRPATTDRQADPAACRCPLGAHPIELRLAGSGSRIPLVSELEQQGGLVE